MALRALAKLVLLAALAGCGPPPGPRISPDGGTGAWRLHDGGPESRKDAGTPQLPDAAPAADEDAGGPVVEADGGKILPNPVTDGGAGASRPADPAQRGPWDVGVGTVELVDPSRGRRFKVDLWYPVDPAAPDGMPNEYRVDLFFTSVEIASPARRDATPARNGPRPLVLFSHGYGGIRFQSYFLTERLASHGLAVASPDHPGNTLADTLQLGSDSATRQSAEDRPLDLLFLLEELLAGRVTVGLPVDPEKIAATGHSFGAWTALEVARRDPRVRVVFPMAPGFRNGATPDFVADLARPLLLFGGSEDRTTPFEDNQRQPYELARAPKALVKVVGAGHLDFSNLCEVPLAALFVRDGCDPSRIAAEEVHERMNTISAAFLGRYLLGAPAYEPYLEPAYVVGLQRIEYWREP